MKIKMNPLTYTEGGGWMPTSHKIFPKFWKEKLLYNGETFSRCLFILCRNFDMSTMCPWYFIFTFHKYSGLILHQFPLFCDFLKNGEIQIQDGGSYDAMWTHMTSQPKKLCHLVEWARGSNPTPPPPSLLYDGGGVSLPVRPRVKSLAQKMSFTPMLKSDL